MYTISPFKIVKKNFIYVVHGIINNTPIIFTLIGNQLFLTIEKEGFYLH